jgi:hypothetical protein
MTCQARFRSSGSPRPLGRLPAREIPPYSIAACPSTGAMIPRNRSLPAMSNTQYTHTRAMYRRVAMCSPAAVPLAIGNVRR